MQTCVDDWVGFETTSPAFTWLDLDTRCDQRLFTQGSTNLPKNLGATSKTGRHKSNEQHFPF
jgi:hypothetical protein